MTGSRSLVGRRLLLFGFWPISSAKQRKIDLSGPDDQQSGLFPFTSSIVSYISSYHLTRLWCYGYGTANLRIPMLFFLCISFILVWRELHLILDFHLVAGYMITTPTLVLVLELSSYGLSLTVDNWLWSYSEVYIIQEFAYAERDLWQKKKRKKVPSELFMHSGQWLSFLFVIGSSALHICLRWPSAQGSCVFCFIYVLFVVVAAVSGSVLRNLQFAFSPACLFAQCWSQKLH